MKYFPPLLRGEIFKVLRFGKSLSKMNYAMRKLKITP